MKAYIDASERMLDIGTSNIGISLNPMVHVYTVNVLAKYFHEFPSFNFTERMLSSQRRSEIIDLAEDSLMFSSMFKTYTANKLGNGGVRFVYDVSQISYSRAGLTEILEYFDDIHNVLCAINSNVDVGELIANARTGDEYSIGRLEKMGVHVLF